MTRVEPKRDFLGRLENCELADPPQLTRRKLAPLAHRPERTAYGGCAHRVSRRDHLHPSALGLDSPGTSSQPEGAPKPAWPGGLSPRQTLSDGNQQKVVLSKILALEPKIIILDEPTREVDVGAKSEIYRIIDDLAKESRAILLISSEMNELLAMCDPVLVMHEGKLTGEFSGRECSAEKVMAAAPGGESEFHAVNVLPRPIPERAFRYIIDARSARI